MKEKCKAIKKNGEPCKAWAMPNGYCRRHGDEAFTDKKTSQSEIEELEPEETVKLKEEEVETSIETSETHKEKPVKKRGRRKKKKSDSQICGALTSKGTTCTFKVMAKGRCGKHQGKPDASPETPPESDKVSAPYTSSEKEEIIPQYSTYISRIIDEEEEEIFKEFYHLLYEDFELNNSSDRMNCEVACIYYSKLLKALKNDDKEAVFQLDWLLREKIQDLKDCKVNGKKSKFWSKYILQ